MSLLDTVEPMIWLRREDISWANSGVANGIGQFSFVQRDGYDIPMTLFAPHKQAAKELADLRGRVESLIPQCRKEALLEAVEVCKTIANDAEDCGATPEMLEIVYAIEAELRRMAEGEK